LVELKAKPSQRNIVILKDRLTIVRSREYSTIYESKMELLPLIIKIYKKYNDNCILKPLANICASSSGKTEKGSINHKEI